MRESGWAKLNSCNKSLFFVMYPALFCLRSNFMPSILSSIVFPRCLPFLTQGNLIPQSLREGNSLCFLRKAKHLVLHLSGLGCVLNLRLCDTAYSSHVSNISCRPVREGAKRKLSSLYPNIPWKLPLIQQPEERSLSSLKRSFT